MNNVSLLATKTTKDLLVQTESNMHQLLAHDEAAIFHLDSGGARTRARICIYAGMQLGINAVDIVSAASAIELLHNASLIHDDLQDGDEFRRGAPSVWKKFGANRAICSGDAMINAAYQAISELSSDKHLRQSVIEISKAVAETVNGQTLDLDKSKTIDSKQYENIAAQKSGPLFRLSLAIPMILFDREDLLQSVNYIAAKFAIAYQIHDDMGDWRSDSESNTLNIVTLLAKQASDEDALFIAKNRVRYLLMMCQKELALFPNSCALEVSKVANKLIKNVESNY